MGGLQYFARVSTAKIAFIHLKDILFEARWRNERPSISALDAFSAKAKRKLINTLGLFLSMNGFTEEGIIAHSRGMRPCIILMDDDDLTAVIKERIDFTRLMLSRT